MRAEILYRGERKEVEISPSIQRFLESAKVPERLWGHSLELVEAFSDGNLWRVTIKDTEKT